MKTEELISLLKEDAPVRQRLPQSLRRFLALGALASLGLLLLTVGLRPDLAGKIATPRVLFKILTMLFLATLACRIVLSAGQPGVDLRRRLKLLPLPALLLVAAVVLEGTMTPAEEWRSRWLGLHAAFCLFFIPVLAGAPLSALLLTLRQGAPDDPGLAGAAAGLAAGSVAAALYAWHCPDDSPFFVASWYMLAILLVTAAGFGIGRRLLRW